MHPINQFIQERLYKRKEENSFRELITSSGHSDFTSNDYLGFLHLNLLRDKLRVAWTNFPEHQPGSGGSRLLSGNNEYTERLENRIAEFHSADTALLFNSGYDCNLGVFSSIPQRGDTILSDEFIHASIIDGIRLSHANRVIFKHNDIQDLENKLRLAKGRKFIAVESVYSMDGDEAPLTEIVEIAERYDAALIVDEAHACGIFGTEGKGIVNELNLEKRVFARIITYGKAMGCHGAAVLSSNLLRNYLINFARSFIYSTSASGLSHLAIDMSYSLLEERNHQSSIQERIMHFKNEIDSEIKLLPSRSPIQIIMVEGNKQAIDAAVKSRAAGFDIRAIRSPTVNPGKERLRICLHNHNDFKEISALCTFLNTL